MITLYLDTSLSNLIVAIIKDQKILSNKNLFLIRNHSEHATTEIKKAFKETNLSFDNIDQIMVVNGPGSFTGLRIGVTIAKTMAYILNKPVIALNSLTIRAISINTRIKASIIDARRDAVYGAIYNEDMKEILKPQYISLEAYSKLFNAQTNDKQIMTPDITTYQEHFNKEVLIKDNIDLLKVVSYYSKQKPTNPHQLNPNYHKKTEAEEKRQRHE